MVERLFKRFRSADYFRDLFSNLGLPRTIVLSRERLDDVPGILSRCLHGDAAGNLFTDCGVEETLEEPNPEGNREDLFQDITSAGQELVLDPRSDGWLVCIRPGQGQERFYCRSLPRRVQKLHVTDLDTVDFADN